jgi:D-alanyl-D-alanine carboxypeptidase
MCRCKWIFLALALSLGLVFSPSFAQSEDDLVELLADFSGPGEPALVAYVDAEGDILQAAVGDANLESGQAAQVGDSFRIGSVTKLFVGTVFLLLQEDDLLSLDDPISDWLPEGVVARLAYGEEIQIRHLLNMTSGIFNYTESDAYFDALLDNPRRVWAAEDLLPFFADEAPYFAPGKGFYYSNSNYLLLEMILNAATGNSLSDELEARIFAPLGMEDSYLETGERVAQNLVRGYSDEDGDGALDDVTLINDALGLADGGIVSTAADMALFGEALLREQELLSEDSWGEMRDWVDDEEGGRYGLGLSWLAEDGVEIIGHDGATAGFLTMFQYIPEWDVLLILWTNDFDSPHLEEAFWAVLDSLE